MLSAVANATNGDMSVGKMIVGVNPVTIVKQTPGLVNATIVAAVTIVILVMNSVNLVIDHLVSKVFIDQDMVLYNLQATTQSIFSCVKGAHAQTHVNSNFLSMGEGETLFSIVANIKFLQ